MRYNDVDSKTFWVWAVILILSTIQWICAIVGAIQIFKWVF